jgi:hypothetical protein
VLVLLLAALAVASLYKKGIGTQTALRSRDSGEIAAQYDSATGRSVLSTESNIDALFSQLSQAQARLNALTKDVVEGHNPSASPITSRTIADSRKKVDDLSQALQDAEERLIGTVSPVVDLHPAATRGTESISPEAATSQSYERPRIDSERQSRARESMAGTMKLANVETEQSSWPRSPAASGERIGFPSHAAERRQVLNAYQKFYMRQAVAAAQKKAAAAQGWDVTPLKNCKGTDCDVQLWLNLQTPDVDYTHHTGKYFVPSMEGLRKDVAERGRLSLAYGKIKDEPLRIDPQGADPAYHFEWQRPGAKHVELGGVVVNGKESGYNLINDKEEQHVKFPTPRPEHSLKTTSTFTQAMKQHSLSAGPNPRAPHAHARRSPHHAAPPHHAAQLGGGDSSPHQAHAAKLSGEDLLPALEHIVREHAQLLHLAGTIETAADDRASAAKQVDTLVHQAVAAVSGREPQPKGRKFKAASLSPSAERAHAPPKAAKTAPVPVAIASWPVAMPEAKEGPLEQTAIRLGRSFLPFLPPNMAEQDVSILTGKTDPALEPVEPPYASSASARAAPVAVMPGDRAERPALGDSLKDLSLRAAQLEGSVVQSLALLGSSGASDMLAKLNHVIPDVAARAARDDGGDGRGAGDRGIEGDRGVEGDGRRGAVVASAQGVEGPLGGGAASGSQGGEASSSGPAAEGTRLSSLSRVAAVRARLRAIAEADGRRARQMMGQEVMKD